MLTTNVTNLRNSLPKYLQCVQQGEHIVITSHGKPIARILPPLDAQLEAKTQLSQLQKTCIIGDVVSPIQADWEADA
ncbi:MAG: type II toxin-antitoxin system prevent-host-death family antitoxin [Legionellaceae bacterium]|nr:type II toxin-antitoxin system prevent-host-death family antitoxin [Legionellaceae bacterium]